MAQALDPGLVQRYQRASRLAGLLVLLVGAAVMVGWFAGNQVLRGLHPSLPPMRFNAGLAFALVGLALLFPAAKASRSVARTLAGAAALIGALTLGQYLLQVDLRIDRALFADPTPLEVTPYPGRMAPNLAANFLFLGTALLVMDSRRLAGLAQALALAVALVALVALVGYAYAIPVFYGEAGYLGMALNAALGSFLGGVAVLLARPDHGFLAIISSPYAGGTLTRRLLPLGALLPPGLHLLALVGGRRGLYDPGYTVALDTVLTIVAVAAVALWTGKIIERLDQERVHKSEKLAELNSQLSRRGEELLSANKELDAFTFSVAHDLRAPLRAIDGFSHALAEDYAGQLDPRAQGYLARVRAGSQKMAQLIDDLLNLSRVSRAELRPEPVDLSALARGVAEELQQTAPERKVTFEIAEGLSARGDARLLRIVLENLLGNAWKFTSGHPTGRITFGRSQLPAERPFFVADDGAGFDMTFASKLFGVFQRLHSAEEFPGTGIGLVTVRRILERHGGRVWAEGSVEKGATFYFTLPEGARS